MKSYNKNKLKNIQKTLTELNSYEDHLNYMNKAGKLNQIQKDDLLEFNREKGLIN